MSKSNYIYGWYNVDNIMHRIDLIIDFKYHTTDLYDKNTDQKKINTLNFNLKLLPEK